MDIKISVRSWKGSVDQSKRFLLKDVKLTEEDFSGKDLASFKIINSQLNHCRFENMKVKDMSFSEGWDKSIYTHCSFDRSDLSGYIGNATFIRCTFIDCTLNNFISFQGEFIDCIFSGKIKHTVFYGKLRDDQREKLKRDFNEFHGNDFTEARFIDVGFRGGVDLSRQKFPVGENYFYIPNVAEAVELVKKKYEEITDPELKINILTWIKGEEKRFQAGQIQYFSTKNDLFITPKAIHWLSEVLRKYRL